MEMMWTNDYAGQQPGG